MSLTSGARLAPYEVIEPLGAGGMGEVFHGTDTRLGREVAIKVLPATSAASPDAQIRFEREGRVVAALIAGPFSADGRRVFAVDPNDPRNILARPSMAARRRRSHGLPTEKSSTSACLPTGRAWRLRA